MLTGWQLALARFEGTFRRKQLLLKCSALGFFNGIAALRVALDPLGVAVCRHISIEKNSEARRVALYEHAGVGNLPGFRRPAPNQRASRFVCQLSRVMFLEPGWTRRD